MATLILGIGGWLLSYTFVIHLLGPYGHTCTQGNDSPYAASMLLGPATLVLSAGLIWIGRRHPRLRWGALPHAGTWVLALALLSRYLLRCTIDGQFICAGNELGDDWTGMGRSAEPWHRLYAPLHLLTLAGFTCFATVFWKRAGAGTEEH